MVDEYDRIVKTDIGESIDYLDSLLNFKKISHFVELGGGFSAVSISQTHANGFRKTLFFFTAKLL